VKLDRSRAALVVVDVQEAFRPAVLDFEQVARNVAVLVRGARILGLPTLVTEQYPKGLGRTVPEVSEHLDVTPI
jgi:nicotinamidase-related amidase